MVHTIIIAHAATILLLITKISGTTMSMHVKLGSMHVIECPSYGDESFYFHLDVTCMEAGDIKET